MSIRHLDSLLRPASLALVGASDRPGSLGQVVLRNLKAAGFAGPVWAVNRRHDTVDGRPAFRDVARLPAAPDLAVICTPAPTVPGLVAALGEKGTRAAVVLSAGLKQASPGGASWEALMLAAARPHLLRILGPNCIGLQVPALGLNASFAPGAALPGALALVTQSGALATAMQDWARGKGIGFSHCISLGDSADVDLGDLLDWLGSEAGVRAILVYAESVKAARKFMSAARAAARNKPVIVVKSGRAPAGARAAASHTGALAGRDEVFDAAARRAGLLRVDTLQELFDAAETLARARPAAGGRLAILTNGGGAGVLAADAIDRAGGELAQLTPATLAALDAVLPSTWSRGNPVDIVGDAPVERYAAALDVLLQAPEVDGLLFLHAPTALVPALEIAQACLPAAREHAKTVLTGWLGGPAVEQAREASARAGLPTYETPERAVQAWLQLVTHARNQRQLLEIAPATLPEAERDLGAAARSVAGARLQGRPWLDESECRALLQAYGIPVVESRTAVGVDEAVAAAVAIGFPVALKIVSPQVVHKTDVGGVALGLRDAQQVRAAAARMLEDVGRSQPGAQLRGFTVQRMAVRPAARELILGLAHDAVFGPVVLCGRGGVEVELLRQHAVALPPLNAALARDLLERSGVRPLLAAWRGRPAADEAQVVRMLLRLSQLACDLPEVAELDINPLLADAAGVLALDARVRLHDPQATPAPMSIRPYPQELESRLQVGDDVLLLRPIRPEDATRLRAFYLQSPQGDLRLRFFQARREVPIGELARFSQIDYDREMAFVALSPAEAGALQEIVADVRAVCDPDNLRAEFAIQVAGRWQGRGLGRQLLERMAGYLRDRGTDEMVGDCLPDNLRMAALARAAGFEVRPAGGLVRMRLQLSPGEGDRGGAPGGSAPVAPGTRFGGPVSAAQRPAGPPGR